MNPVRRQFGTLLGAAQVQSQSRLLHEQELACVNE